MFMLVLPQACKELFPGSQAVGLASLLAVAGATQLVSPAVGILSDRCTLRLGRRRPFILIGTLVSLVCIGLLWRETSDDPTDLLLLPGSPIPDNVGSNAPFEPSANVYFLAFGVLNLALNTCFAAYSGLIPDFVSSEQLGEASGVMAVMNALGSLLGVWLIGFMLVEPYKLYMFVLSVCCFLTLFIKEEQHIHSEGLNFQVIGAAYFQSLDDPNFFWVWISRLLYYTGISVQVFLQYFVRDMIHLGSSSARVQTAMVTITMLGCAAVVAVPFGRLSDKIGRLPLVYLSSGLMALTYMGWALSSEMWQILAWGALFGLANGCFISVEFAIGCDVLPNRDDAAQSLGVWGIAAFLGSTLGPVISGPVLLYMGETTDPNKYSRQGYVSILVIGAFLVLLSSLAIRKVEPQANFTAKA
mmetsp:Transcript_2388/g.4608  ORF Transcript_2388/g.4608 Transcript_2388/m.4608 type:complete len:414 (-) Transcript_2388:1480-2721(-)